MPLDDFQQAIVTANLHLVEKAARSIKRPQSIDRDDIISAGYLGLCYAAARGAEEPWALRWLIRRFIERELSTRLIFHVGSSHQRGHLVSNCPPGYEFQLERPLHDSPIDSLIAKEERDRLHAAIPKLKAPQRHSIEGRLQGLTIDQLGVHRQTASDNYRKGLRTLRGWLRDSRDEVG